MRLFRASVLSAALVLGSTVALPHAALAAVGPPITIQSIIGAPLAGYMVQPGGSSDHGAATPDGRFIVFDSDADDLVAAGADQNFATDVFLRDNLVGAVVRISDKLADGSETDGESTAPQISADGRFVSFLSTADGITADDGNGGGDVYVYDRTTRTFSRASVSASGRDGYDDGFEYAADFAANANANIVAFTTDTGLASLDTNEGYDVYARDRAKGTTYRVSSCSSSNGQCGWAPSVDGFGCQVSFTSDAPDIVGAPADALGLDDIFVRNVCTQSSARVSLSAASTLPNGPSKESHFAAGGRYVAFASKATNLVSPVPTGVTGAQWQIYLRDLQTATTTLVSRVGGTGAAGNGDSTQPAVSTDGCAVAFTSASNTLTAGDTNGVADLFVVDRCTGGPNTIRLVSMSTSGGAANAASRDASFAVGGERLTFGSSASNLFAGDANNSPDVFSTAFDTDTTPPNSLLITNLPTGAWALSRSLTPGWFAWDASGFSGFSPEYRRFAWNSTVGTAWAQLPGIVNPVAALSAGFYGSTGRTYCWRLTDAIDTAGNHATGPSAQRCRMIPLLATQLSFDSRWVQYNPTDAYGGVADRTSTLGATMTRTGVRAKMLAVVATTCNGCGTAAVKWNGKTIKTLNFQATATHRMVVFGVAAFSSTQAGTLQLVVTSSHKPVVIEGLGAYQDG